MMPDIETYAPYIHAIFSTVEDIDKHIPYSIADTSIRNENNAIDTFIEILDLTGSRFEANRIHV